MTERLERLSDLSGVEHTLVRCDDGVILVQTFDGVVSDPMDDDEMGDLLDFLLETF